MSEKKVDWIIHYVANGASCDCCGKIERDFPLYICNAHTHGMERYNHLDFQIVIDAGMETVGALLNIMGTRVRDGEYFKDGDVVAEVIQNYNIRLKKVQESGRPVLRIIIPDAQNRFPDDIACEYPYDIQGQFKTE